MMMPTKVYIVDARGDEYDIRIYKSKKACGYFNNKAQAKIYEGTILDWNQIK